jgi:hypothetical protein
VTAYDLGDAVELTTTTAVDGVLVSATVGLVVTRPDGTTTNPTVTEASTGSYTATLVPDQTGTWFYTWTASGGAVGVDKGQFAVANPRPTDYVSLATVIASLKAGSVTDADRDTLLATNIAAASRSIDNACGRKFWLDSTVSARRYNPRYRTVWTDDGELLLLDDIGSAEGLIVEVGSDADGWVAVTDYETVEDNALARGWPITGLLRPYLSWQTVRTSRVRVTAQWGWPQIPDEVQQAALIQAIRLFKRKESPEGVMGTAEWGVIRLSRVDPDVQALIQHLIIPGIG